ncbi:hypothetical protein HNY73_010508 [Argiope bruennichi]|uniref:Uncharacterized protein n=1 Tax=Argiope bruennichi TaxID=94029 RepID=A0A8T0F191_ARGBR|nr:hypothetical protein HNY73_010508 [Argiope bruennichi]
MGVASFLDTGAGCSRDRRGRNAWVSHGTTTHGWSFRSLAVRLTGELSIDPAWEVGYSWLTLPSLLCPSHEGRDSGGRVLGFGEGVESCRLFTVWFLTRATEDRRIASPPSLLMVGSGPRVRHPGPYGIPLKKNSTPARADS